MASVSAAEFWTDLYARGGDGWEIRQPAPALVEFMDLTPPAPGRVAVPGCGRGHDVRFLARRGFSAVGFDFSAAAVAQARKLAKTDNVSASHGGTVGELDEDQIFYMMCRGLSRLDAVRVLVEGYFEEVVQRLDDPGLEELVRRRISEKLAGAEDQVREFIGERAEAS